MKYEFDKFVKIDLNLPAFILTMNFGYQYYFIPRFAKINQLISETGLDIKWQSEYKFERKEIKNYDLAEDQNILLMVLLYESCLGFSLAIIVFLMELFYHYCIKKILDKRSCRVLPFKN